MDRTKNADYYRKKAHEIYHSDGEIEVDDRAGISDSGGPESGGCYVQAWVWVDDPEEEVP